MKTSTMLNYQAVSQKLLSALTYIKLLLFIIQYRIKSFKEVVVSVLHLGGIVLHLLPLAVDASVLTTTVPQTLVF